MEPEHKPYEIVPDETEQTAEDMPVVRLEKIAPEPRQLPGQQERKPVPVARLQQTGLPEIDAAIPFQERQVSNHGGVEKVWGTEHEKRAPLPWVWISVLGILAMILIIGGIVISNRPAKKDEPVAYAKVDSASKSAAAPTEAASEADAMKMINTMEAAVRHYCAATNVEERLKYVRQPERVKILMEARYPDGKVPALKIRNIQFDPLTMENRADFWFATVETLSEGSKNLIVELPDNGDARIDWEVDVLYQPYSWDRFVSEPANGESHDFRVHAMLGVLYSHEFSNEKEWRCYVLSAPGSEAPIFGYCAMDSAADRKLTDLLRRNNNQSVPIIVELKRPTGILSPQGAIIEEVLSESWINMGPKHPGS